jgi:hypothetical protein
MILNFLRYWESAQDWKRLTGDRSKVKLESYWDISWKSCQERERWVESRGMSPQIERIGWRIQKEMKRKRSWTSQRDEGESSGK